MFRRLVVCSLIGMGLSWASSGNSQTVVAIGVGSLGTSLEATVPVRIAGTTPLTALNIRLRFDPAVLTLVRVGRGPMLAPTHQLYYLAPPGAGGQLNIVTYSPIRAPFTAPSGTVVELIFRARRAPAGSSSQIMFDAPSPSRLPSSDLSDAEGRSISHLRLNGSAAIPLRR